jgi:hypothetical protein
MKLNNIVDDGKERTRGKMGAKFIMLCREKMKWEHKLDVDEERRSNGEEKG